MSRVYKLFYCRSTSQPRLCAILQGDHYTFSGLMSPRTACRYSEAAEQNNRAFCDKSIKFAIHVTKCVTKRFGY